MTPLPDSEYERMSDAQIEVLAATIERDFESPPPNCRCCHCRAAAQLRAMVAERRALREALVELVACKDLKDACYDDNHVRL